MIVSCLLTRRCNLRCSYCRIIKDYDEKPDEYPSVKQYIIREVPYTYWCALGDFFKSRDKNVFMLLYGGEPTLYKDLMKIVDFYNERKIFYSIITNGTHKDFIIQNIHKIKGLTCSVDPGNLTDKSRVKKSDLGWKLLVTAKSLNKKLDAVAEVTLDSTNYKYLPDLIQKAKDEGIRLSVTIIEKPENKYYDFADLSSKDLLLSEEQCKFIKDVIKSEEQSGILISPWAIMTVLEHGSQNLTCDLTKEMFYVIDSDFRPRLCLRIRGILTPKLDLTYYIRNKLYDEFYKDFVKTALKDQTNLCKGCSWTCAVMGDSCTIESF